MSKWSKEVERLSGLGVTVSKGDTDANAWFLNTTFAERLITFELVYFVTLQTEETLEAMHTETERVYDILRKEQEANLTMEQVTPIADPSWYRSIKYQRGTPCA